MPLYAYRCINGHVFEQTGKIDGSDEPTKCPVCPDPQKPTCQCEAGVTKILVPTASIFPGADSWRSKNGA